MGTILQLLISGIAMGFIYALVAIEYTLIWNSTGLLNFSHDKIITVGAYIFAATFIIKFNMNKPLAIVLTFMLMGSQNIWNSVSFTRIRVYTSLILNQCPEYQRGEIGIFKLLSSIRILFCQSTKLLFFKRIWRVVNACCKSQ